MALPDQLTTTEPVERTLSAQTTVVAGPHENGNGNGAYAGITEIPQIAYLQQEFADWLTYQLERSGLELDRHQRAAIASIVDEFADQCYALLEEHLFPRAINRYTRDDLERFYVPNITQILNEDPSAVAVILDQAIFHMVRGAVDTTHGERLMELSMSRPHGKLFTTAAGGKVPRVGYPSLDEQVATIKAKVGTGHVFLVDDTTVEGGTLNTAMQLLEDGGVRVMSPDHHMVYFITKRGDSKQKDTQQPFRYSVQMSDSLASIELREMSVLGGAQEESLADNSRGYVIPAFPPFSDGTALRMAKEGVTTLNAPEVAASLLAINRQFVRDLAGVLGKKEEEFTIASFPLIPSDPATDRLPSLPSAEPSAEAPNENGHPRPSGNGATHRVRHFLDGAVNAALGRPLTDPVSADERQTYFERTPMDTYLAHAEEVNALTPKPDINVVGVDVDGTMAGMNARNPKLQNTKSPLLFRETALGDRVLMNGEWAVRQLLPDNQLSTVVKLHNVNVEQLLQVFYHWGLDRTAEEKFGDAAKEHITQVFIAAYGNGRGRVEANRFIDSMPLRYHALRYLTWGDLPLDEIYTPTPEGQAFAKNINRRGGQLAIVTAAPRVHALRLLTHLGLMQDPGFDQFELYTVEDLYDPATVPRRLNPHPSKLFVERDKSVVLNDIHEKTGTPKLQIAMGGDVFATEVRPALFNGFRGRVVRDPQALQGYANSMKLPGDDHIPPEELLREFHVEQKK